MPAGITREKSGLVLPVVHIIANAPIMEVCITAMTAFPLFMKDRFYGTARDGIL